MGLKIYFKAAIIILIFVSHQVLGADCTYNNIGLTLSSSVGCSVSNYVFTQKTCNQNNFRHSIGASCTITFPNGTDASAGTVTWRGNGATITSSNATSITFTIPSNVGKNITFDIVVSGVVNGISLNSNCAISANNTSGGINSNSNYSFTTTACASGHTIGTGNLNTCTGNVYDSGGSGSSYLDNEDEIETYC